MSKCLRCKAGPEWIEGRTLDEPERAAYAELRRLATECVTVTSLLELPDALIALRDFLSTHEGES